MGLQPNNNYVQPNNNYIINHVITTFLQLSHKVVIALSNLLPLFDDLLTTCWQPADNLYMVITTLKLVNKLVATLSQASN